MCTFVWATDTSASRDWLGSGGSWFSQSLLRVLVSSTYSWQREARILHSHLPFSWAVWNRERIKSKRQIWEVPWISLQSSPSVLSSPPPAKLKAKLFLEPRWLDGTLGQFVPGKSKTSPCATCRHPESLPLKPSGKWCLEPSGDPPDLQLLLRPPQGDTVLDQPKPQTQKGAVVAQEVCSHFRGPGGWLMPGRVPAESVYRLRGVPVRKGSPCRDEWQ